MQQGRKELGAGGGGAFARFAGHMTVQSGEENLWEGDTGKPGESESNGSRERTSPPGSLCCIPAGRTKLSFSSSVDHTDLLDSQVLKNLDDSSDQPVQRYL